MKKIFISSIGIITLLVIVIILGSNYNSLSQQAKITANKRCGIFVTVVNNDNNGSDIYQVKFTNVQTGEIFIMWHGDTEMTLPAGIYDAIVYTDCQGKVSCSFSPSTQCQDAYSWNGDSQAYYFSNVNSWGCGWLTIAIDEIEC